MSYSIKESPYANILQRDIASIELPIGLNWDMLPTLPLAYKTPRNLVTRSGARVRGINLHPRFKRCKWESGIERNLYALLTITPSVQHVFSQPLVIRLDAGEYTPDALVFQKNGQRIWIECKHLHHLDSETQIKLGQAAVTFAAVGDRFIVVKDSSLSDLLPEVINARRFAAWYEPQADYSNESFESGTYSELMERHGAPIVNGALARGELALDFTDIVTDATPVSISKGGVGYEPSFLRS